MWYGVFATLRPCATRFQTETMVWMHHKGSLVTPPADKLRLFTLVIEHGLQFGKESG
jgi:hypothetical protein